MNSIVVGFTSGDARFAFDPDTRVELLFKAALRGVDKEVRIAFRLVNKDTVSEVVWFESRVLAYDICLNYKRLRDKRRRANPISWARDFVDGLIDPDKDGSKRNLHASALEIVSAEHFTREKIVVNFDPYSLDDDAKVGAFFNYRRILLSADVKMGMLIPFIKDQCFCSEAMAERRCLLCDGR